MERDLKTQKDAHSSLQAKLEEERAAHKKELEHFRSATESDKDKVVGELQDTLSAKAEVETKLRDETELRKSVEAKNASLEESLHARSRPSPLQGGGPKRDQNAEERTRTRSSTEESEARIAESSPSSRLVTAKVALQNKVSDLEVSLKTATGAVQPSRRLPSRSQLQDERNTTSSLRDEVGRAPG